MDDLKQVDGRLVCLHWPKGTSDATLSDDTSQLQEVKAEIEDTSGVIHLLDVLVRWDADYLVGKEVTANSTDDGTILKERRD